MAPKSPWIAGFYNHLPLNTSTPLPTLTLGPLNMDFRKIKVQVRSQDYFLEKFSSKSMYFDIIVFSVSVYISILGTV